MRGDTIGGNDEKVSMVMGAGAGRSCSRARFMREPGDSRNVHWQRHALSHLRGDPPRRGLVMNSTDRKAHATRIRSHAMALAIAILVLGTAKLSSAADLKTATLFLAGGGGFAVCTATNTGKKPVDVDMQILDATTGEPLKTPTICSGLDSLRVCSQEVVNNGGLDRFVLCRITASATVRGLL